MNTKQTKTERKLKIAVQKSGRLSEDSLSLIRECGIRINRADNKLKSAASNFPLELLYLRDDDIPEYVADGVADIGIVGENVVLEKGKSVEIIERLGFGKCRLSIAVPEQYSYQSLEDLSGTRIATSYPKTLRKFLDDNSVYADIREIRGSAEIAPSIGLAEAVCDLVSSGSTLLSTRLKEVEVLLESEAVLIAGKNLSSEASEILSKLLVRVRAVQLARNSRYILLNAPNTALPEIIGLLPGMKSPTVLPLAEEGWSSVHTVIDENDFWEIIEKLQSKGAEGILVVPIEKMFA
jgi:ATP phosphoribosyltransferase